MKSDKPSGAEKPKNPDQSIVGRVKNTEIPNKNGSETIFERLNSSSETPLKEKKQKLVEEVHYENSDKPFCKSCFDLTWTLALASAEKCNCKMKIDRLTNECVDFENKLKDKDSRIAELEEEIEEDNKKFAKFFKKSDAPKNKMGIKLIDKAVELGLVAKSEEGFLYEPEDIDYDKWDELNSWVNEQQKIQIRIGLSDGDKVKELSNRLARIGEIVDERILMWRGDVGGNCVWSRLDELKRLKREIGEGK